MPAANPSRKIVVFSDFDGTIFMQDSGHVLVNNLGCGAAYRENLEQQMKSGERSFIDISEDMWGSLTIPFEDGLEVMKDNMQMDPGFQEFHHFCVDKDITFNVISSGLKPVLRGVLDTFLGPEESSQIEIVANDAEIKGGEKWKPVWRHETELGHDKARSINEGRAEALDLCIDGQVPLIIFIGDGATDLPAAREADVLFARKGLRLEQHCTENNIPFISFESFAEIKKHIEGLLKEDADKTGGQGLPARFNPRANMWRRISSKQAVPKFVAATPRDEKVFLWPETFSEYKPKNDAEKTAA